MYRAVHEIMGSGVDPDNGAYEGWDPEIGVSEYIREGVLDLELLMIFHIGFED